MKQKPLDDSTRYNKGLKPTGISRRYFIKSATVITAATALPFSGCRNNNE